MTDNYVEVHDVPQIPWAKNVRVTGSYVFTRTGKRDSVELATKKTGKKASVISNGDIKLEVNTREYIGDTMSKARDLQRSLYRYYQKSSNHPGFSSFASTTIDWIRGVPPDDDAEEPYYGPQPGILDWAPGMEKTPPVIGKIGYHGSGQVKKSREHWIGTDFRYIHFRLKNENDDEGLVIQWNDKEKPEVWVGDVDSFFMLNEEDFEDWEAYRDWNDNFENGFLWGLDYMGQFEANDIPKWAVEIIEHDPDLMWPDLVQKLLPMYDQLPADLSKAMDVWMERRRVEAEEATGQRRFWPRRKA